MLERIVGDNAGGVIELARQEIDDDGFEVGSLDVGFAVSGANATESVDHEINGLIRAVGYERWGPARSGHTQLHQTPRIGFKVS